MKSRLPAQSRLPTPPWARVGATVSRNYQWNASQQFDAVWKQLLADAEMDDECAPNAPAPFKIYTVKNPPSDARWESCGRKARTDTHVYLYYRDNIWIRVDADGKLEAEVWAALSGRKNDIEWVKL